MCLMYSCFQLFWCQNWSELLSFILENPSRHSMQHWHPLLPCMSRWVKVSHLEVFRHFQFRLTDKKAALMSPSVKNWTWCEDKRTTALYCYLCCNNQMPSYSLMDLVKVAKRVSVDPFELCVCVCM